MVYTALAQRNRFESNGGFRPVLDNGQPRTTPPLFLPPHLASLSSQFTPPLFPSLKGQRAQHIILAAHRGQYFLEDASMVVRHHHDGDDDDAGPGTGIPSLRH
uniref:Uncharacterized protein n=1 Tax=Anopheles albimanus TaxID=7167 RepID=A0A182F5Q4_ANOAL